MIYESNKEKLFEIGNEDIVVYKSERKEDSYCQPSDDFIHVNNLITYFPSNNQQTFIPKRIQIFQMIEDEEMKQMKEKLFEKEKNEIKEKMIKITKEMKENKSEEMKQIEDLCYFMKMKEVIFDSDYCDCSIGTSLFDKLIHQGNKFINIGKIIGVSLFQSVN